MNKTIDLAVITDGKMTGTIEVSAYGFDTRYSWGHIAEVSARYEVLARAKICYLNRTWETYRFQSAIHCALREYVRKVLGIDPLKSVSNRDKTPMKSAAAEVRRIERVSAIEFAAFVYNRLTAYVDGRLDLAKTEDRKVA